MLKCALCGIDIDDKTDGYVRGSISGEVFDLLHSSPRATGQKNSWDGLAFCLKHFEDIPKNISENLATIAKRKELNDH